MTEYAPDAIKRLFDDIKRGLPGANLSGILGDSAHTYGYHRGRNYVDASSDYSCQYAADKKGDGEAACALDLTWDTAQLQYDVSRRLLNAKNDPRMSAARSFFGSQDGISVIGWDFVGNYACTSDDSHLWHIHVSLTRETATQYDKIAPIAEVITGQADDDMNKDDTMQLIAQALEAYHAGGTRGPWNPNAYPEFIHKPEDGIADRLTKLEKFDHVKQINDAINSLFWGGDHGAFTQSYAWVKDEGNGVSDRLTRLEGDQ